MFTGIIEAMGQVAAMTPKGGDVTLLIKSDALDFSDVQLGDSIAVNGVCLTATALPGGAFEADVSGETLSLTSLKQIAVGSQVNLEKALTPTTRLGGHLVSGHVDGLGKIVQMKQDEGLDHRGRHQPDGEQRGRCGLFPEHHPPYPRCHHHWSMEGGDASEPGS